MYLHINSSKVKIRERTSMSFKDIFVIFTKNDHEKKELEQKIASLQLNMEELKKTVSELENTKPQVVNVKSEEPPIIIEKINIEKIILDKYELNNNFGQLGIKELKGKLNIGATYGSEFIPKPNEEEKVEKSMTEREKVPKRNESGGLKVNIHTKKEE